MSGDVQPRKRKEKRRKKDSEEIPTSYTSDEQLHVHKDASTGGNICAKILFFLLSFVLVVMIGLVLFEYRGVADGETLVPVSKWAATFDGWLETPVKHDEHADLTESGEQEHEESGEHESAEGEEHVSDEAGSKEDEEDEEGEEEKGSEEEIKSEEEEEEEEEEDEDEEADKLEDEESEEVDENEIGDRDEDDEQEEYEEEEESEEDVYGHGKSEEDLETEKEDADDDDDAEEEDEEEDVEAGREELDDDEERETSAYQRDSNEIEDVLNEIPGITESDEDEEGDNLGRSDEIIDELPKIPGVNVKKIKAVSEEEVDVPRQKLEKEVGGEMKSTKMSQDKAVDEEEEEEGEGEDEPEPSGVALKFGVGVALVIVAHVVLVKKWNSDENLAASNTTDAPQSVPQVEQKQISKQIPQILVEPEIGKDSEESSNLSSEYITRRQTLLPDDLVHSLPQRELEESESSVPSEEESDDGQEEFIFRQNVYKAENAFKASHRDENPFSEEKPYKQPSFEELMKKYHEHTPEGSDIESDEDEQEEEEEEEEEDDDRDIDDGNDDDDDDDDDELIDDVDDDDDENEEPEDIEEISEHKGQGSKISTTPETEGTSPQKFIVDTQKEQRKASMEQKTGIREEDEILAGEKEDEEHEEEEHEEEDTGEFDSEDDSLGEKFKSYQLPKARKLQKGEDDDDSGSEKEIPVTKSKIPKNMGGRNAQVYSKADITNEDDWHIIQDLDRADDDADEDLNF